MGSILQLFKDLFLVITTGFIVFWFIKDYRKAILWYLVFYAFISLVGLGRVIYNENVVIPLMLLFVLMNKPDQSSKPNVYYLLLFIYLITLTYINGLSVVDTYSRGTYLFLVLLIYSRNLFSNPDDALKVIFLIWMITIGIAFSFLVYGEGIFSVSDISTQERNMQLNTGIKDSAAKDLNYFSSGQAIGAIITLMFIIYRRQLINLNFLPVVFKQFLRSKFFHTTLIVILAIQVWFVFRSLSRGGILVFIVGILSLVYLLKKKKYILYGALSLVILYLILNQVGIIDLLMDRFEGDETGISGRNFIYLGILQSVYDQGGIFQILFGAGIDWPWYDYWIGNTWGKKAVSTHNQWLSLYVSIGLLGLFLFLLPLIKGIRNSLKNHNLVNHFRIVLFACFFVMALSLEPLVFIPYVWFIVALAATYTPNYQKSINEPQKAHRIT